MIDYSVLTPPLTTDEASVLDHVAQECTVDKWETLLTQGEKADALYIIQSGELRVVHTNNIGAKQEFWIASAGDIVGEMAMFSDENTRNATITAQTASRAIKIPFSAVEACSEVNPEIYERLSNIIQKRLEKNFYTLNYGDYPEF